MFKFFSKENTSGEGSNMTDVKAEAKEFLKMSQVIVLAENTKTVVSDLIGQ